MSRGEFEQRLKDVFDPFGAMSPFLDIHAESVTVYDDTARITPVAKIAFTQNQAQNKDPIPEKVLADATDHSPNIPRHLILQRALRWDTPWRPLNSLCVVIDPADIGGAWGSMEDRSSYYRGYGRIQEGDLNLMVGRILKQKLEDLGASVFLVREKAEPVCSLTLPDVMEVTPKVLFERPDLLSKTFRSRTRNIRSTSPSYQKIVAEILLTKNLEAIARASSARAAMNPDITIVLQFDSYPSGHRLAPFNRNILFVEGAYTPKELSSDSRQRLRLMTKLLGDVTPLETEVALAIASRLKQATGFDPVGYGDSRTTRSVKGSRYVVARNLLLNREHDGPVVVTEPYFMNQRETLQRLLAGDYDGVKVVAGEPRESIFREYAEAVASGLVNAFGEK